MINLDAALDFAWFVQERHRIWEQRQAGEPAPWTADATLRTRKFTNVFRVLDPGSQFIFELEAPTPWDTLARIFLYRHTNLPAAWRALPAFPLEEDLTSELEDAWKDYRLAGNNVFSGAYVVRPSDEGDKIEHVVRRTKQFMDDSCDDFLAAGSQGERFSLLRRTHNVGPFMAMQILTDWGYTAHCGKDREDEFVVLGPGAERGAKLLDPVGKPMDTLMWAVEAVRSNPACPTVQGRKPSWMDIQNCFCEFSKYVKGPVSSEYRPAHPGVQPEPVLPKHFLNGD